jgi:predicted nicotinamide N-methyase
VNLQFGDGALVEMDHAASAVGIPLVHRRVVLPRSRCIYDIARPRDVTALQAQVARDQTGPGPYWAMLWPSGIALADAITHAPALVRGQRVLELGCGLGVTASAAIAAGADLTVADCTPEVLALCRANARHNAGQAPATRQCDWRQPETAFAALGGERFPVVLGADVIYDPRDVEPLLALLERVVAPSGVLWLAEPGRSAAQSLLERADEAGWRGKRAEWHGPWPSKQDSAVVVAVHQLRRPGIETALASF